MSTAATAAPVVFYSAFLCYPFTVDEISLTIYAVRMTSIKREHILAVLNKDRLYFIGFDYPVTYYPVLKRIPEILYSDYIPRLELFHIAKEVRASESAVNSYNAVSILSADRIGGIGQMSAACHHIIVVCAEEYRKLQSELVYLESAYTSRINTVILQVYLGLHIRCRAVERPLISLKKLFIAPQHILIQLIEIGLFFLRLGVAHDELVRSGLAIVINRHIVRRWELTVVDSFFDELVSLVLENLDIFLHLFIYHHFTDDGIKENSQTCQKQQKQKQYKYTSSFLFLIFVLFQC